MSGPAGAWSTLDVELRARAEDLAPLRRQARAWMAEVDVPEAVASDVLVALSEAATNAVLHAYAPDIGGSVWVQGRRHGNELELSVEDRGRWQDRSANHDGRGLAIIAALATSTDVRRGEGGTRVVFRCALSREWSEADGTGT